MTINAQVLEGNWNEIKGKLRERWGELTQDDLQKAKGDVDKLVGMIERKTGEARRRVEQFLGELTSDGASGVSGALNAAREAAQDYMDVATSSVEEVAARAAEIVRDRYQRTGEMVARKPLESVAVGFGAGLVTGVVVGLILRSR